MADVAETSGRPRWLSVGLRVLLALAIAYVALLLRLRAAASLPFDRDEGGYLTAALVYGDALAAGDWDTIIDADFNFEHPPLAKLTYGAALRLWPEPPYIWMPPRIGPEKPRNMPARIQTARVTASIGGAAQVFLLALAYPPAGALLAVSSWHIKYTAEIMLEGIACVFSTGLALAYIRARHVDAARRRRWLLLSGALLGLTAACKYAYALVGVVVLLDWLPRRLRETDGWWPRLRPVLAWGLLSLAVFAAANPRLWRDPASRLWASFTYHFDYAKSEQATSANLPPQQQLVWLASGVPWHVEDAPFLVSLEPLIFGLALLGIAPLWRRERVLAIWLLATAAFLTWWTTKWPQYLLLLLVPQMVAASEGARWLAQQVWRRVAAQSDEASGPSASTD